MLYLISAIFFVSFLTLKCLSPDVQFSLTLVDTTVSHRTPDRTQVLAIRSCSSLTRSNDKKSWIVFIQTCFNPLQGKAWLIADDGLSSNVRKNWFKNEILRLDCNCLLSFDHAKRLPLTIIIVLSIVKFFLVLCLFLFLAVDLLPERHFGKSNYSSSN